ncbi:carboxypeptidase-like regulatory domain-containing protein [uncultured Bacteroides sp.]|uniref:carboxypeptidase-like regulatory domain-containing protein n=1 Tax=uncultured Bacteroides sp. TaxID=162156 RepID=UPI002AAC13F6|nr:carboxypeptidase-like regulatory domain-containing protein [uncultured Bacteroides sp.]
MRTRLLIVYWGCCLLTITAQTFKGRVINDATKKPIEMVSVNLMQADSMTVAFSMTERDGRFSTAIPAGKKVRYLCFTCMGFASTWVPTQGFMEESDIYLQSKAIMIKEVKYVSKRLKQEGDTLKYSVSGFRMPQDRCIGDVIKKLPGIEVSKEGEIKYQGKPINSFYIEGLNLLEGKYSLATNNLSAKAVKEVQVLENHQKIAALRGKSFTDNAALNLVLEDKAKSRILGTIDVGLGAEDKTKEILWSNRLLGMLFNGKMQNLSMYKNDNTGVDVASELNVLTYEQFQSGGVFQEPFTLSPITVANPDLDQQRYYFNKTHLFTVNNLWKLTKDKNIRFQGSYLHDEQAENGSLVSTYFLPNQTVTIDENIRAAHTKDMIDGELAYYLNSKKYYLKNSIKFQGTWGHNNGWMQTNGNATNQATNTDKQIITEEFQLIKNMKKNTFRLASINKYSNLPQHLTVTPGQYADLLNNGYAYESMQQDLLLRSFSSHTYTSFQHKLLGMYVEYRAGLKIKAQSLQSALATSDNTFPQAVRDSFLNRSNFTETDVYLTPSISYQNYKFKGEFSVSATLANLYQHNKTVNNYKGSEAHLLFEPNLHIRYSLSALLEILGSASYSHSYSDIYNLYPGYIFTDYRSASACGGELAFRKSANLYGGIQFKNPIKGFFFSLSGFYLPEHRNMLTSSRFNGILQQTINVLQGVNSDTYNLDARYNQSFSFWKTLVKTALDYTTNNDTRLWSEVLTKYRINTATASVGFLMQPCKLLNWEEKSTYTNSIMETIEPVFFSYPSIQRFQHKFTLNVIPSDKFQLQWVNEFYHSTDKGIDNKYFSDVSFSYIFGHNELKLSTNNIFNTNAYERINIGSLSQSVSMCTLRPRQFLVKYLFDF